MEDNDIKLEKTEQIIKNGVKITQKTFIIKSLTGDNIEKCLNQLPKNAFLNTKKSYIKIKNI